MMLTRSTTMSEPSFTNKVIDVVRICPNKQMGWVHAAFHVAVMAHKQTFRYWPNKQSVRNAMSAIYAISKLHSTVPLRVRCCRPNPAAGLSYWFNFLEKSLCV
jgi:hypothetical protein